MGRAFVGRQPRLLQWAGPVPTRCECCGDVLVREFVDAKTSHGPWGCFCVECAGQLAVSSVPALCRVFQLLDGSWVTVL